MRKSVLFLCLAVLLAPEVGLGQQPRVEEVTEVVVVEVPVQVIQDGEPVRGLTAEDFEITEGRKKREIIGFDVVDLEMIKPTSAPVREVPVAARRHFLFFFDLSFSDPGAIVRARRAATELVEERLHATDLAAVGSYSNSTGAQLILGFTPDREQVKLAITTLGLPQLIETKRDPLGLTLTSFYGTPDSLADEPPPGEPPPAARADVDSQVRELLFAMIDRERRATSRNEILALSSAMTEFADMMQGIEGRKYVVFLSEGFDSSLVLGNRGTDPDSQRQIESINQSAMTGRLWEVNSNERFGDTTMQTQVGDMLRDFVRADCIIQAVDIGGAEAGAPAVRHQQNTQDSLFMMANETGGNFYPNHNDLNEAMDGMLRSTSVTYVLAFQLDDLEGDGKWRKLNVKLKDGGQGAQVVHRPGYYPPQTYGEMNTVEKRLALASAIMGAPGGRIDSSVLAAPFNVGAPTAYVPVLIEIDGTSLMAGTDGNLLPIEIYAYAIFAQGGTVRDFFVQSVGLDLSDLGPALDKSGLKYLGHFDLPTGDFEVRVLIRNGSTGASGVATSRIRVPDFESGEMLVLPPLFPEQRGEWILGREDKARQGDYPYPFTSQEKSFIPAAKPVVRSGESARMSLVTYNYGGGMPGVEAAIYSADGGSLGDVEIRLDHQEAGDSESMVRYGASCELPAVDEGTYKLEITLVDPESGDRQTSSIDVQVVG